MPPSISGAALIFIGGVALGAGALKFKQEIAPPPSAILLGPESLLYKLAVERHVVRSRLIFGGVVLLGNSHVVGLPGSLVAPNTENFGINSDTVQGLSARIGRYRLDNAAAIVVSIGANDLGKLEPRPFGERYAELLAKLPSVKTVVVSVFPSATTKGSILREYNDEVQAKCRAVSTCTFLDMTSTFANADGMLRAEFRDADGDHLSESATAIWASALQRLVQ